MCIPSAWFRFTIFIYRCNFHSNKKIGAVYLYQLIVIKILFNQKVEYTPPKPINYSEERTKRQDKCVLNTLILESKAWILLSDWLTQITVLSIINKNRKPEPCTCYIGECDTLYFQPKMDFFFIVYGYILTVNNSSHVPVLNFEKKNCVIQNAIITWTDIFLEHVYFVFSILA
jgi:hypothetical protein